ncbi:hypothetical protein GF359_04125, partial [candidate division WOR-3 bacterium]|nr:hypothetical protein [candidate division WOR-3 bacterium]MBD3364385.1 hypothetical protein [candidate division WOR-3 bacterium]
GIQSDSSKRFAAGIDCEMVRRAAVFFIHTLADLCPELSVKGELAYGQPGDKGSVNLEYSKLDTYANTEIDKDKAKKNLELIGFDVEQAKDGFTLKVPSHRNDMAEDVDAIEEVLRLEGYDNLPSRFIVRTPEAGCRHPLSRKLGRIRNFFTGLGYNEIYSLSLISAPEVPSELTGNAIPITNPLSERLSVLRPTLLPGMLSAMAENIRFGNRGLYFFEIGSVYRNTPDGFKEPLHLGIMISGEVEPIGWDGDVRGSDYFDLKGAFEMFSEAFGHNDISFKDTIPSTYLDVEACRIIIDNKDAGYLGKVDAEFLRKADIPQEVYFCEVNMSLVLEDEKRKTYIKPLPRFKPVERDMALLLDASHDAAEVMQFVKEHAGELCSEVEVFDSFTGSPLPKGKRNLGLRLRFQPSARNLSKEEVDERIAVLSGKMAAEFDALVRGREGNGS